MAPRRRPSEPPKVLEIKVFTTPQEIDQGITKLRRRLAEVGALDPHQVRYDAQEVRNVEQNISNAILEVFGLYSPEYQEYQGYYFRQHASTYVGMPDYKCQEQFTEGIGRAITMLGGLIARVEEKRAELGQDASARVQAAFEGLDLHPRIATACADLYRDRHYANAVEDAAKALINFVKEKSGRHDLDGAPLMQQVFSPNNPILVFNDLADQTDRDEQQGMMFLFTGAVLALRNPRAHKLLEDSPERALEYIGLLNMLANRLEEAKRRKSP